MYAHIIIIIIAILCLCGACRHSIRELNVLNAGTDVPSEAATVIPPARVVVVRAIAVAVDKILFTLFLFIVSTPFLYFFT